MNRRGINRRMAYMIGQERKAAIMAGREAALNECSLFPDNLLFTRPVKKALNGYGAVVVRGVVYTAPELKSLTGLLAVVMTHRFTRDITVFIAGERICTAEPSPWLREDQTYL
jgi:hypothetical protein